jgi:hypothetical protein
LTYGTTTFRLAAWATAALLGLVLATEARADDGSAQLDEVVATDPVAPPDPGSAAPSAEQPAPVDEGPADETPGPVQPPVEETPAPGEPPAEGTPPPDTAPPPGPPVSESPPPEPPPTPEPPVAEPTPTPPPEPPVDPPVPTDPIAEPVPPPEPGPPPPEDRAAGAPRDPIVIIKPSPPPVALSPLFPSPADKLTAATGAGDRLDSQGGSRSQAGSEGARAPGKARKAPLLPGLPFRGGASSDLYVSAGGSSGSSGGFFPLVLAGLVALFAAVAQRHSGLLSLTVAPPHCSTFVLCLERPD